LHNNIAAAVAVAVAVAFMGLAVAVAVAFMGLAVAVMVLAVAVAFMGFNLATTTPPFNAAAAFRAGWAAVLAGGRLRNVETVRLWLFGHDFKNLFLHTCISTQRFPFKLGPFGSDGFL
jgi:hypothetical protein